MLVDFLLGPAGSGKTFRCLAGVRAALALAPEGLPLVFLAPKQATFQLERELLASPALSGYTRLQILSFDRLAEYVLNQFFSAPPRLLSEEGRVMVLRALLAHNFSRLKLFHASARLPGFAQQLSKLLDELQQHRFSPERLLKLTVDDPTTPQLRDKLHDLALLLRSYLEWLDENDLQDPNGRLELAADVVKQATQESQFRLGGLWLDGFSELTPQELDLLMALAPSSGRVTLAFCLDRYPQQAEEWHSMWATISHTFRQCYRRLEALPGFEARLEVLERNSGGSRFAATPALAHLERYWAAPQGFESQELELGGERISNQYSVISESVGGDTEHPPQGFVAPKSEEGGSRFTLHASRFTPHSPTLKVFSCPDPETEAVMAAREILRHVHGGGRFRDTAVLVRSLQGYERVLARVFSRYGIAFFIDRREPLSHHPLAELTRYALRTVLSNWEHDDWFGALKTGLVHPDQNVLDRLENLSLARGWRGNAWFNPFKLTKEPQIEQELETLRRKIVPPFRRFVEALAVTERQPTGAELAAALRGLWDDLDVAETIEKWSKATAGQLAGSTSSRDSVVQSEIHAQAVQVMEQWLDNLELAFENNRLPLGDWILVVEAGLASLTAGVIPLALDEVLIGQVDRSRNPNLELALMLGLNETVFPAPPAPPVLLSEHDRESLGLLGLRLGLGQREQIGLERFLGYIACTRARQRLVLTYSQRDAAGKPLNPSLFIHHLQRLFPALEPEQVSGAFAWWESVHANELVAPLLKNRGSAAGFRTADSTGAAPATAPPPPRGELARQKVQNLPVQQELPLAASAIIHYPSSIIPHSSSSLASLETLPLFAPVLEQWDRIVAARSVTKLSPGLAEKLYGPELKTSISNLEDYAACHFKFFVVRGLRAEERPEFEVDPRERGSFLHEILMEFHRRLQAEGKRWRDLTPSAARELVGRIGAEVQGRFRDGLFASSPDRQFTSRALVERLQRFIEVLVEWAIQYRFEPQAVELGFGLDGDGLKPWRLDLGTGRSLFLRGRIDRIDLHRQPNGEAYVVVIDYKAGGQKLEQVKLINGLDLQLLAYLAVLRDASNSQEVLTASKLIPAGAFYVGLRNNAPSGANRVEVLNQTGHMRRIGYQHRGRFRADLLAAFDDRDESKGDQFRYARKKNGDFAKKGNEALPADNLLGLVGLVQNFLRQYGQEIYAGDVRLAPFRHKNETACEHCEYRSICRFDPWVEPYRMLKQGSPEPAKT